MILRQKNGVLKESPFIPGLSAFTLPANYFFAVLIFDFFGGNKACSYQFTTNVADELHFSDSIVALKKPQGQKLVSFF